MAAERRSVTRIALIVALGGFLMGFDASVISGVVGFIEDEFQLSSIELGWGVASLTLAATLAMMAAGPLSDRFGRKPVLRVAAVLFAVSAIASALAPGFGWLVAARVLGGFGVGAALIIAPMYIAEIAPAAQRGRMVSLNQLNIVIGISAAFFSNYLVVMLSQSSSELVSALNLQQWSWRWMLGLETLPALLYWIGLLLVPESPRWLLMHDSEDEASAVLSSVGTRESASAEIAAIKLGLAEEAAIEGSAQPLAALFEKPMRLVLAIGLTVGILQQITGINSVFFYAPMIFEMSGLGKDAAFMQAVLVGLTNLAFTLVAMALIDRVGRKPLLLFGVTGIAVCMLLLAREFAAATYTLPADIGATLTGIDAARLQPLINQVFASDVSFREAAIATLGSDAFQAHESELVRAAITVNPAMVLGGILGFVACFAMSLGPVMWVLFSELFPNRVRAVAVSFVGLVNSAVSFLVQLLFPWQLSAIGAAGTFMAYGLFAVIGLVLVARLLPETRGKSLEELEKELVLA
jgi:sugar porter (SP) family MFS transporter